MRLIASGGRTKVTVNLVSPNASYPVRGDPIKVSARYGRREFGVSLISIPELIRSDLSEKRVLKCSKVSRTDAQLCIPGMGE